MATNATILFTEFKIRNMLLKNRFVRSATHEAMATQGTGRMTPELVNLYKALAEGDVGLIISSHAAVTSQGQVGPRQLLIESDEAISGFKELVDVCHHFGARIAIQLAHGGAKAKQAELTGLGNLVVDTLTNEDIAQVTTAFAEGARRAKAAGADAVQIHCAHGYFLSQTLSPAFNHRTDRYGGDAASRATIALEVVRAVRNVVGPEMAILVKMNSQDFIEPTPEQPSVGQTIADTCVVARLLQEAGVDAIELSGGIERGLLARTGLTLAKEAYHKDYARAVKQSGVTVPLILVGGIRSFGMAAELLEGGVADLVSLSRPFIRQPSLVKDREMLQIERVACISCNRCFPTPAVGSRMACPFAQVAPPSS
ncbi:putative NADH:flavin oxidoreductase [Paratrimastix pyriformis]|uniref:NADH:flavin oxidoreductase n=1 Tax=Paratrimastix pyriformis TaxID=342808 RepID=A0ABQ8UQ89_9EUKA|nr:putative NADH:flavin oxidoreductase [Paratrimastix pyriformis]